MKYNIGVVVGSASAGVVLVQVGSDTPILAGRSSSALTALAAALELTPVGATCMIGTNSELLLKAISPPYAFSDRTEWWSVIRRIAMRRIKRVLVGVDRLPLALEAMRYGIEVALPKENADRSASSLSGSVRPDKRRRSGRKSDELRQSTLPDWTSQ